MKNQTMARFDARITTEQRNLFEKATEYGGYKSKTDFIISIAEREAKEIIANKESILASEKDAEIFAEAILNPRPPSQTLLDSVDRFQKFDL